MVSLANDSFSPSTGSRGAFFFDDLAVENDDTPSPNNNGRVYRAPGRGSINDGDNDDDAMLIPPSAQSTPTDDSAADAFVAVKTPWILALECLVFVGLEVAAFVVPHFLHKDKYSYPEALPYYILVYAQGALWFVVFGFDRLLWSQHRKAQARGYLEFYRSTRNLRQAPFFVVSLFTAIFLLMATFLQQFPNHSSTSSSDAATDHPHSPDSPDSAADHPHSHHDSATPRSFWRVLLDGGLDRDNLVQAVVTLEVLPALLCVAVLVARTVHFNGLRHPPDVQQEEAMMQTAASRGVLSRDVGFRDASLLHVQDNGDFGRSGADVEELLEKQSDQIRYLKSHNANLSRKILKLNAELQNRNR